jgi:hypothetical protein
MTSDSDSVGLVGRSEWLQTRPRERCLVAAAETNGAGSVVEILSHPGDRRPTHFHQNADENFLTLESATRLAIGSESFDCSERDFSIAEGHFKSAHHLRQGPRSSLVRRLVLAKAGPVKQRIRAWLSDIDDERLFRLGLTAEDIAALRNTFPTSNGVNTANTSRNAGTQPGRKVQQQ